MASSFFKRIQSILHIEKVEFEDSVIAELVKKHFPDFRRVINELQRYSQFGKIDTGILAQISEVSLNEVTKFIKDKDFGAIRKWVGSNDIDNTTLFRKIYDSMYDALKPHSIPQAVLILADYQYKAAFVADQEINTVACLTELMVNCEFK
jgi:DNA polymerase III delta prime subunit